MLEEARFWWCLDMANHGFKPFGLELEQQKYDCQQGLSRWISLAKLELDSLAKRRHYRKISPIQLTSPL
jgi:hypothetical protein